MARVSVMGGAVYRIWVGLLIPLTRVLCIRQPGVYTAGFLTTRMSVAQGEDGCCLNCRICWTNWKWN